MPNNHGYCSTSRCACWDVDAYKAVGVAATDMDNGVCVVLGDIKRDANKNITGFEYTVTAAQAASTGIWVVRTPEVGVTIEMQLMNDPRYFYNPAGQPMSLCYMNPKVDMIEVNKEAFVAGSAPSDKPNDTFVTIGAGGKFATATAAPASGTYFSIVGNHYVDVGQELMPTYILRCERN